VVLRFFDRLFSAQTGKSSSVEAAANAMAA